MLTNIPTAVNKAVRNVVINHPNSYNCVVVRKVMLRADTTVGGMPTIGGMMVLNSTDEEDIQWELLGNGYALPAENFTASQMMDRQDANNNNGEEFRFLVVPETAGEFQLQKNDVFYLVIANARLAYEIIQIETTSNVPPYTERYVCNRRDDLHFTV